jgi:excisionase family DNA binding protein
MRLLRIHEAAERLGVKDATIRAWIWQREIDYVKVGRRSVRIASDVIDEIIRSGTVPAKQTFFGK